MECQRGHVVGLVSLYDSRLSVDDDEIGSRTRARDFEGERGLCLTVDRNVHSLFLNLDPGGGISLENLHLRRCYWCDADILNGGSKRHIGWDRADGGRLER